MLPEIQDLNEEKSPSSVWHPLDPLSRDEISLVSSIVRKDTAEEIGNFIRFETIELKEPPKNMVRAFDQRSKVEIERQAFVNAFRIGGGIGVWRMVVSITKQQVVSKVFLPKARPMIQLNEFVEIENVVKKDARVIEACAKRGITNMDMLCVDPWSCGAFGSDFEEGRHISYTFLWVKSSENDNLYAHPVDGVNAVVDIKAMDVIQVDDWCVIPIPQQESNYCQDFIKDSPSSLKPINIQQPEGVSFSIKGRMLHWYEWSLLIGFNAREGITLHNISFGGRPICYRASLAEMIVPYGSPRPPHFRKNAFDIGEYGLGRLANSLELGCDCLGAVQYLDCWINDTNGDPMLIKNGICIHEEDHGILWKHWDFRTERTEVRRARRLVISTISTVANYEYGCYWYLMLDGSIEFEVKATGIINTVGCEPGKPEKYGTEVSPGVVGQIHQHLFCARLDLAIDGDENSVLECDTVGEPIGPDNPYGNAYYVQAACLEKEGGRPRKPETERFWKFINPNKKNHVGQPTGYKLEPAHSVQVFTHPDAPISKRMGWVRNHLWITRYDPDERYPAGEYVNQSDGSDGLPTFVEKGRSIQNTDLVAWHVFGLHHPTRTEDFPVQNCVNTGFKLMPNGFFDRNPNIELPPEKNNASSKVCCH